MGSEWAEATLGEISNLKNGKGLKNSFYREDGQYPVWGANGQIARTDELLNEQPVVVIGRVGAYCGSVHAVFEPNWVTDNAIVATPKKGNSFRFLYYFLKYLKPERTSIGSAQALITQTGLKTLKHSVPPISEQLAIAHILGSLDDKIELNRKMNKTLEAMARAIFKSWFVDFDPVRAKVEGSDPSLPDEIVALFPDNFEDSELGPIPKGWKVKEIRECCSKIQNGGTPKRSESDYWNPGTIPWLTSGEVRQPLITTTENMISEIGLKKSSAKWLPKDSAVVALYGATSGQVAFISSKMTTNQAVCGLIPKASFRYFNYLSLDRSVEILANLARGSAQQNISKGIVETTKVIIPRTDILISFDQVVSPVFDKWVANLEESKTLAALRDTLLPKLISGELRVPEAEKLLEDVV